MTAKKVKQVKKNEQLTLENISIGDIIPDLHDEDVEITDNLIEQMRRFEKDTKKSAIWRNKITGTFLYFKYFEDNPKEKKKPGKKPKTEDLDEQIETEAQNEEDLLLDCISDYQEEFGVKKVNTNTKKFKEYYENWKKSE